MKVQNFRIPPENFLSSKDKFLDTLGSKDSWWRNIRVYCHILYCRNLSMGKPHHGGSTYILIEIVLRELASHSEGRKHSFFFPGDPPNIELVLPGIAIPLLFHHGPSLFILRLIFLDSQKRGLLKQKEATFRASNAEVREDLKPGLLAS